MGFDAECIFCRIIQGDIPGDKVYEDELVIGFRDIQPAAPVHVLILPREHIASLHAVGEDDTDVVVALLRAARVIADREGISGSGYRVVTNVGEHGGQSVGHLHFHLLGGRQLRALG